MDFKIKCIKSCGSFFEKGKVYEFIDGRTVFENGLQSGEYKDFNEFINRNKSFAKCIVEVKDEFSWESFKNGDVVVCCKSLEDAKDFLSKCENKMIKNAISKKRICKYLFQEFNGLEENDQICFRCSFSYGKIEHSALGYYLQIGCENIVRWKVVGGENMVKFDWNNFKEGKIAVHCETEDEAKEFLRICKENNIKWSSGRECNDETTNFDVYNTNTAYSCIASSSPLYKKKGNLSYCSVPFYFEGGKEIIKWKEIREDLVKEIKKEPKVVKKGCPKVIKKSCKEVINEIKDGERWLNTNKSKNLMEINREYGAIGFVFCDKDRDVFTMSIDDEFMLVKEVGFLEALRASEEGKQIESCVSGARFKRIDAESFEVEYEGIKGTTESFSIDEIEGKWYIL